MEKDQHPLAKSPVTHMETFNIFSTVDVVNGRAEAERSNGEYGLTMPAVV